MKKKLFLTAVLILSFFLTAFSQQMNRVIKDSRLNTDVLVGPCNLNGLQNGIFAPWFNSQYKNYIPNAKVINEIKKNINKTHITIVFGSWCGDSKMQMGRFYKILNEVGFNTKNLRTIAVDYSLKVPGMNIKRLKIKRIPTFIVYYKGKEIGRIVESPSVTLESDLENILRKID